MTEKTALLLNELTPAQKNYVTNRLAAKEKDLSVAYLCWFFCIHYFYLRKPVRNYYTGLLTEAFSFGLL